MPFDPQHPLPRPTLDRIRTTAVGQASPVRLRAITILGALATVGAFVVLDDWWLAAIPLVATSFGVWALATQATQRLDLRHERAPRRRLLLRLVRIAAVTGAVAGAVAGVALAIGAAMEIEVVMDWLGR